MRTPVAVSAGTQIFGSADHRRAAGGVEHGVHVEEALVENVAVIGHRVAADFDARHERIVVVQFCA